MELAVGRKAGMLGCNLDQPISLDTDGRVGRSVRWSGSEEITYSEQTVTHSIDIDIHTVHRQPVVDPKSRGAGELPAISSDPPPTTTR